MADDARQALEKGSPLSAIRRFEAVLAAQPDDPEVLADLARAWLGGGDQNQAIACFSRAIDWFFSLNCKAEAAVCYVEILKIDSRYTFPPKRQMALAAALEEKGEFRAALSAFRLLIRAAPDSSEGERALLRVAAIQLQRLNAPEEAAASFEEFLGRFPRSEWRGYASDQLKLARKTSPAPPPNTPA
jgi:tetratricopeptide (TPR) repeat protein